MKTKTFFLIVSALALFLSGCQKDDTFFVETEDNAVLKSAVVKEVPIKMVVGYSVTTHFNENDFPMQGICGGIITHLGTLQAEKSIWYTTNVVIPNPDTPWIFIWTQEGDFCAANSDLLHWTVDTDVDMLNQTVSGTTYFNGGTGRFKNAEGYFNLKGHPDPDDVTRFIVDEGIGMISNVGSGK